MKILISILFICFYLSYAKSINAIEVKINDEIITTYDIQNIMQENKKNKKEAIDFLINKLIKKEAIRRANISVGFEDINQYISQIVSSSGASMNQFRARVLTQMKWSEYIQKIKEKIQSDKFEQNIIVKEVQSVNDNILLDFYKKNKNEFKTYKSIKVVVYSSKNQLSLLKKIKTPLSYHKDVKQENSSLKRDEFRDKNIYKFLSQMKTKTFSPIIPNGNKLISYFVVSKIADGVLEYDKAVLDIKNLYAIKNKEMILEKYLKSIKLNSKITYVQKK